MTVVARIASRYPAKRQRGMILIMAMMIIVLVTSVVVTTTWNFQLGMARNENRWHGSQARKLLDSAEEMAMKLILMDTQTSDKTDHEYEFWSTGGGPYPTELALEVDGIEIRARIVDAQSLFNVNSLHPDTEVTNPTPGGNNSDNNNGNSGNNNGNTNGNNTANNNQNSNNNPRLGGNQKQQGPVIPPPAGNYTINQRRFIRLLQVVGEVASLGREDVSSGSVVSQQQAMDITDALIDWLDKDSNPRGFGGAETGFYENDEFDIVISNDELISKQEVCLLKPFLVEEKLQGVCEALLPYITVLPKNTPVNVNTMQRDMFRIYTGPMGLEPIPFLAQEWQNFYQDRQHAVNPEVGGQGIAQVNAFIEMGTNQGVVTVPASPPGLFFDEKGLDVRTEFFELRATVIVGEQSVSRTTLIQRKGTSGGQNFPVVVSRSESRH